MATKPSSLPRWADVGGDIVEPTSGEKNVGWEPDTKPPAQYFNWWQNLVYQWMQYLNDGALSGAHTFSSTVGITGAVSAASAALTGALTAASATLSGAINAASAALTGSATVGGTLGVTGLITASAGLTAATDQHVTVLGDGNYKHGEKSVSLPMTIISTSGSVTRLWNNTNGVYDLFGAGGDIARYDAPVHGIRRLRGITVGYYGGGASAPSFQIFEHSATATSTVGTSWGTASNGALNNERSSLGAYVPVSNRRYSLEVTAGNANDRVGAIVLHYDVA